MSFSEDFKKLENDVCTHIEELKILIKKKSEQLTNKIITKANGLCDQYNSWKSHLPNVDKIEHVIHFIGENSSAKSSLVIDLFGSDELSKLIDPTAQNGEHTAVPCKIEPCNEINEIRLSKVGLNETQAVNQEINVDEFKRLYVIDNDDRNGDYEFYLHIKIPSKKVKFQGIVIEYPGVVSHSGSNTKLQSRQEQHVKMMLYMIKKFPGVLVASFIQKINIEEGGALDKFFKEYRCYYSDIGNVQPPLILSLNGKGLISSYLTKRINRNNIVTGSDFIKNVAVKYKDILEPYNVIPTFVNPDNGNHKILKNFLIGASNTEQALIKEKNMVFFAFNVLGDATSLEARTKLANGFLNQTNKIVADHRIMGEAIKLYDIENEVKEISLSQNIVSQFENIFLLAEDLIGIYGGGKPRTKLVEDFIRINNLDINSSKDLTQFLGQGFIKYNGSNPDWNFWVAINKDDFIPMSSKFEQLCWRLNDSDPSDAIETLIRELIKSYSGTEFDDSQETLQEYFSRAFQIPSEHFNSALNYQQDDLLRRLQNRDFRTSFQKNVCKTFTLFRGILDRKYINPNDIEFYINDRDELKTKLRSGSIEYKFDWEWGTPDSMRLIYIPSSYLP